ncbi:50S ribosomal protein L21 [Patescibacteria group bacterium]|nr:50S ribosomal protein L21 [Patescibacteria group bacterium]MBU1673669.1 50S ribosomal protein L21 [Patescibacteria group bacterium]MBU1963843.1 50S ribosomal protein L21 [Patescibacteria group bacterium]
MIAVIKTGGKQYKVSEKDKIKVEKIDGDEGKEVVFDQILMVSDDKGKDVKVGTPIVSSAKVKAKVLRQARDKKVEVVKYKNKTRYKRKAGHRQHFTEVEILEIK